MKIAIVSGKSEGPTELNAFDNALMDAGIGDVNLIKVSSMLGANTEIIDLPKLKAGSMVNCVLSTINSKNKGDTITACIAIAIGDNLGCVVENAGINISNEENRKEPAKTDPAPRNSKEKRRETPLGEGGQTIRSGN